MASNPTSPRPNVLVFFTDQQRWDTGGCYGSPLGITPHLDAMARRGTKLEYSFTVQPLCGPARSCLQTGKYATKTGVWRNSIPLREDERTLAHEFGEAGYRTGYIGKWHLASTRTEPVPPPERGGYQDWYATNVLEFFSHPYDFRVQDNDGNVVTRGGYRVEAQTDFVLEYLRQRAEEPQPFFLFVSYLEPHFQNDQHRFAGPKGSWARFKDAWVPEDLRALPGGDWLREWPDYVGCCASLDEGLGRVLAQLRVLGLDQKTVVLFCSDHGCHFRTRNSEYKRSGHESSIRVPAVMQGPGLDGGHVVRELVSLLDWPATLLDAAGLPVPESMQGRSFLPLVRASGGGPKAPAWPQEVLIQISESHVGRALRTKKWKYGLEAPKEFQDGAGGSRVYVETFLYDLEADPHELKNLLKSAAHTEVLEELRGALKRRMAEAGEERPEIRPA